MTSRIITCESENLQAIAELNGRAKSNVFVRERQTKTQLLTDEINPASLIQREAFLARLPENVRPEASQLLNDVAEAISVERAKGSADQSDGPGQVIAFPETAPWPSPVDGAELLDEIAVTLKRFLVASDAQRDALALFVLHAHTHDAAQVSPIMNLTSAEKRSGKTIAANVIGGIVPRPVGSANLTTATLFRAIERYHPTVIADEVDAYLNDRDELRGILNSSHLRSSAFVMRCVGDDYEPRRFSTWAPIILIGLRASRQHDTIRDRSIIIELRRRTAGEKVERWRLYKAEAVCGAIRRRAVRWAVDHLEALKIAEPEIPLALNDRAADNWHNMLAIADLAGAGWGKRARVAALLLSGDSETTNDDSHGIRLLADMRQFFADRGVDRAATADIISWLTQREDRQWGEWYRGKPLTGISLSKLLKPYKIAPKTIRLGSDVTLKGYELFQFADAFLRYLPSQPQQPSHPSAAMTYDAFGDVTDSDAVTGSVGANSLGENAVTGVTGSTGGVGDRGEAWEPDEAQPASYEDYTP